MVIRLKALLFILIFSSFGSWAEDEILIKVIQSANLGPNFALCNYLLLKEGSVDTFNPFQFEPAKVWDEGMNFYYDLYKRNKRFSPDVIDSLKKHGGVIDPQKVVMQINYYKSNAEKTEYEIKATIVAFRGQQIKLVAYNFDIRQELEELQTPMMKDFPEAYREGVKKLDHDAVYEIGKMGSLDLLNGSTLPPSMLVKAIQLDAIKNFNASASKTLIVAHAMSEVHARLYSNKYGLQVWKNPVYMEGDSNPHYIVYNYLDKVLDALNVDH